MWRSYPIAHHAFRGFTLAELLISLTIIGIIATFTVPKILASQQNSQRTAVFKETIASANAITQMHYSQGDITVGGSTNASYLLNEMNAVQKCASNAQTQGCWTQTLSGNVAGEATEPGLVLHNGATIIGLKDSVLSAPHGFAGFAIDWNGAAGPNLEGDDQIEVLMCWESNPSCWTGEIRTGTVGTRTAYGSSYSLLSSIFNQ